jgi:hypothetical protein
MSCLRTLWKKRPDIAAFGADARTVNEEQTDDGQDDGYDDESEMDIFQMIF